MPVRRRELHRHRRELGDQHQLGAIWRPSIATAAEFGTTPTATTTATATATELQVRHHRDHREFGDDADQRHDHHDHHELGDHRRRDRRPARAPSRRPPPPPKLGDQRSFAALAIAADALVE